MRTYFEPDDIESYESTKALLIRRAEAWARHEGVELNPLVVGDALDFRHDSIDGRLGTGRSV
ncbi:MAG TPA: hypothetical protein VG674_16755 [Amycolatopsis sp.]|jgi:hypothetical protein|nr:hypothetical protein [Amycolatopsis sp.]